MRDVTVQRTENSSSVVLKNSENFTIVQSKGIEDQKIEKVKELIVYDELNLTEIADKLHYSSVAHLSNQFKKMTGLTPSHFKNLKHKRHSALGNV